MSAISKLAALQEKARIVNDKSEIEAVDQDVLNSADSKDIKQDDKQKEKSKSIKFTEILPSKSNSNKEDAKDKQSKTSSLLKITESVHEEGSKAKNSNLSSHLFLGLKRYLAFPEKPYTEVTEGVQSWHLKSGVDLEISNTSISVKELPESSDDVIMTITAALCAAKAKGWNEIDVSCDAEILQKVTELGESIGIVVTAEESAPEISPPTQPSIRTETGLKSAISNNML